MQDQPDFISVPAFAALVSVRPKTLYNQHSTGKGTFASILTKVGGRLGVWRSDYENWRQCQLRIPTYLRKAA